MDGIKSLINHGPAIESILHTSDNSIAIIEKQKDDQYAYTYLNPSMKKKYGDFYGKRIWEAHKAEAVTHLLQAMKNADHEDGMIAPGFELKRSPYREQYRLQALDKSNAYLLMVKNESISVVDRDPRELKESKDRYQSLVEMSPDSVFVHDKEDKVVYVNVAGMRLLGAERKSDILGEDIKDFIYEEPRNEVSERLNKLFAGEFVEGPIERKMTKLDGSILDVEMHGGLVEYHQSHAIQTICRNITERRKQQSRLKELAYYDQLTNVSNRRYFFEKLQDELEEVERSGSLLSVLFIDLDNFKEINDQFGHQIGDDVLVIFTKRVKQMLRTSDTLSRLGGDEFVVLLSHLKSAGDPPQIADRMLERITQPIVIKGHTLSISVSIGIAIYPDHGSTKDLLLTRADQALYEAKKKGRRCVEVYKGS